jgi:HAD superfamily hydrolase (TIGR01509 family)
MRKLVIFDMDGVLLDSESLYMGMNQQWFKEIGVNLSLEKHRQFVGVSAKIMWQYLVDEFNLPGTVQEYIQAEKELKYKTLLAADLKPTDGLIDFLNHLKTKNHKITLASSSLYENIDLILTKLNVAKYFEFIVSGGQVTKGKPEPDIFLKVSAHYDMPVQNCLVIEDSTNGVVAAKAAGMFCIGYNNPTSGNQDLAKADVIINSFREEFLYEII